MTLRITLVLRLTICWDVLKSDRGPPRFAHGTGYARSAGREESPCVYPPKHPRTHPQMRESAQGRYAVSRTRQKAGNSRKHRFRPAPAFKAQFARMGEFAPPASFSLLHRARRVFSFSSPRKRENGGCSPKTRRPGGSPSRPRGANPDRDQTSRPPAGGPPSRKDI